MAGAAPNFSVTGFQLSEVKKPNPKAFHAGSEPITRERMTPARSTRTAIAEHWVMILKVLSPRRKRRNTLVRSARSLARSATGTDWSAMSITVAAFCETHTSVKTEAGAGRWCSCLGLADLVHRSLDICGPHLLDSGDHGVRHGDVIQFLGHFGRSLRLLINEDPGGRGHRPGIVASLIGQDHAEARHGRPIGM